MTGPTIAAAVRCKSRASFSRRVARHRPAAKAKLQGRPGPSPLQPYRELRRLWRKSVVNVDGSTLIYPAHPRDDHRMRRNRSDARPGRGPLARLAARRRCDRARRRARTRALRCGRGKRDSGSGFALMGASRDLTFSSFVEPLLLLAFAIAALRAGSTDLRAISDAGFWNGGLGLCGALVRRSRIRLVVARGDGTASDRQPRHAPRVDDGPRRPATRVRRTRPRLAALERRGAPLDHAGARHRALRSASALRSRFALRCSPSRCRCCCVGLAFVETAGRRSSRCCAFRGSSPAARCWR